MLERLHEYLSPVIGLFGENPLIKSAIFLVLVVLFAWILRLFVDKGIRRLIQKTKSTIDDEVITLIHKPLFWTVMITGLVLAMDISGLDKKWVDISKSLGITLLIFMWMIFLLRLSSLVIRALCVKGGETGLFREQTAPLFTNLASILIIAFAVYFMFQAWNIDMTAWIASAGIAGIAIGFAAKDTLANLFSGVFILADSPYKIGDYIVLDDLERGKITHIGIRSTRMLTRDDVEVTIPNSIMGNSKVTNQSGGPYEKYRLRVKISIAYGSDLDQIESLLLEVAENEPQVCQFPTPRVRFRTFGPSAMDFELLCWVEEPELRGWVTHKLNTTVYNKFRELGLEIPYTKQELYIKELPKE